MKLFESIRQDVSYALRAMRRAPLLTLAAVLSLGLGIGANTAIFSLVDAIMLRNLPVRSPQELVQLAWGQDDKWPERFVDSTSGRGLDMEGRNVRLPFSYDTFQKVRARTTTLSGVFGRFHVSQAATIIANGRADTANADLVSGNFFDVLGVVPAQGRLLAEPDDREGEALTAVLSHEYWVRRFAADPDISGKSILVNGVAVTIAGVAAESFKGVDLNNHVDMYLPLRAQSLIAKTRPNPDMRSLPWRQYPRISQRKRSG